MAAQEPPKEPFQPLSETASFPPHGILDGFFNGIRKLRPFLDGAASGSNRPEPPFDLWLHVFVRLGRS
jgi:hypothetical protein